MAVLESLGVSPDQLIILVVGGDAASEGAQEVMQALSIVDTKAPDWKHVCKVWPQPRTKSQSPKWRTQGAKLANMECRHVLTRC